MTIEARSLTVAYGRRAVVEDVSFTIGDGEFVALIGPNGAGKSALLRALARLQRPRAGAILLDGVDLWGLSPRQVARQIAWVPGTIEAPLDLTVSELLQRARYPYQSLFGTDPRATEAIGFALESCTLAHLANRRLGALSAGEKQRATLAAGLAQDPKVLLLDEPTAFLDLQHALEISDLLATLNRERSVTVVVALHDLTQAARYCSRAVVLHHGRLVADGTVDAVLVPEVMARVFGVRLHLLADPVTGRPVAVPHLISR